MRRCIAKMSDLASAVDSSGERVEALFSVAMAFPPEERLGFLHQACGENDVERQRVWNLLNATSAAGEYWRAIELSASHPDGDLPLDDLTNVQLGPYHLLREIGEGGCARVYLARQSHPIERLLAVKVLKAGMDTREVNARFAAERQLLAMLQHPNVAQVFDAGVTAAGRSFFVMELVRGVRITDYCDLARLTLQARIQLVIQACRAIHHAHQHGIIHRDIKPSNLMVTLHDGEPVLKIIDFGIAKALQASDTSRTRHTVAGPTPGTPDYMSPEQAGLLPDAIIDARSDVYGIGVLLHELITGSTPSRRRASGDFVAAEAPFAPSRFLKRLPSDARTNVSAGRRATFDSLVRSTRGDLDAVLLRCLHTLPSQRYASAADVAADLQRWLRHEPVQAREAGAWYIARKFASRHRVAVGSAAAVLMMFAVVAGVSSWLAVRAMEAEARAVTEANIRGEVLAFLQNDILAQASPNAQPNRDIAVRVVLDRAAQKIAGRFAKEPMVEAAIHHTLGATYLQLGELEPARSHMMQSLAIHERVLGRTHTTTLDTLAGLAEVEMRRSEFEEALRLAQEVLSACEQQFGSEDLRTWEARALVGAAHSALFEFDEALPLLEKVVRHQESTLGRDHIDTLSTMSELIAVYIGLRRYESADTLSQDALQRALKTLGESHPGTTKLMNLLALIHTNLGRLEQAEAVLRRTLATIETTLGAEHPDTLVVLGNLAQLYLSMNKIAASIDVSEKILAIQRRTLGPEHHDTLHTMSAIAVAYFRYGDQPAAIAVLSEALELRQREYGIGHPSTLVVMNNLAKLYELEGRFEEAERLLTRAYQGAIEAHGPDNHQALQLADNLSLLWLRTQRWREAAAQARDTLERRQRLAGEPWRAFATQGMLGEALMKLGRPDEAEPLLLASRDGLLAHAAQIPQGTYDPVKRAQERLDELHRLER